uniref:dynein axonemal heavy chain 5-like n=1 Tax=Callithrix jacchus TaxID=9483 RepID=UPI0023DD4F2D
MDKRIETVHSFIHTNIDLASTGARPCVGPAEDYQKLGIYGACATFVENHDPIQGKFNKIWGIPDTTKRTIERLTRKARNLVCCVGTVPAKVWEEAPHTSKETSMQEATDFGGRVVVEGDRILKIDQLFAVGGLRHLMFYYQDVEETGQLGSLGGVNLVSGKIKKPKVFVTEGKDVALTGACVFFIRTDPSKAITPDNIHQEVSFNMLDAADGGLLNSVRRLLLDIFIPALRAMSHGWGELEGLQDTAHVRQEFLSSLEGFVNVLSGAQESLKEKVNLRKCDILELKTLKEPMDYLTLANNPETLEKIEDCMKVWIKQTEQVLAENNQLWKEADDVGPRAELRHWYPSLTT